MACCRFFPIYIQKGPSAFFWFSVNTKFPFFTYISAVHPVLQTNGINGGDTVGMGEFSKSKNVGNVPNRSNIPALIWYAVWCGQEINPNYWPLCCLVYCVIVKSIN